MNRRQFEEIRRWGEKLRSDEREELRAAGEAIRLLSEEIERIGRELIAEQMAAESTDSEPADVDDTLSDEEQIDSSLRTRLQRRLATLHR
jgi:hypothetical protein